MYLKAHNNVLGFHAVPLLLRSWTRQYRADDRCISFGGINTWRNMADWRKFLWTYVCIYVMHLIQSVNPLQCFKCPLSSSHEECGSNSTTDECQVGTRTCSTQVKFKAGTREVLQMTRSCMLDTFCMDELSRSGNKQCLVNASSHYVCVFCCHSDFCNDLPVGRATEGARCHPVTVWIAVAVSLASIFTLGRFRMPDS
eukprot:XP_011676597.1 PREDICTED: uncharacterized protein LOC105444278 [Strongylocentrotus purpuratus]